MKLLESIVRTARLRVVAAACVTLASALAAPAAQAVDFATRCADANVVRCYGFEDAADLADRIYGRSSDNGIYMTRDTAQKASGAASLRAEIPPLSGADTSGSFFINFSDDLTQRFGEGTEFYVQWRQRFSPEMLRSFRGGNGWKQIIVGAGDYGNTIMFSCSEQETVFQQDSRSGGGGHPWVYHSCGRFVDLEYFDGTQIRMQHQGPPPCYYPNDPQGGCKKYVANQWMTFQMNIKVNRWNQNNSRFRAWAANAGEASVQIYDSDLSGGMTYYKNNDPNAFFGKVWFLPYNTNKDETDNHPTAYTWYDDLVISRTRVADPDGPAPGPQPTVTLSANPTSIPSGATSVLTWSSTNSNSCSASGGWSGSKAPAGGTQTVGPLTATQTYTLTCTATGGETASQSATVTVASSVPVPTVTLSATPTSVASGTSSTLDWTSSNATTCTASGGWTGNKATQGSQSVGPITAQTSYTLACSGAGGSAQRSVTVSLIAAPGVTFNANPTSVTSGNATTLTWSSTNASGCVASGAWSGNKAASGSEQSAALSNSSTFQIGCTGAGGTTNRSVNVTVTPGGGTTPPPPPPPAPPPTPDPGDDSGGGSTDLLMLFALLGLLGAPLRRARCTA